MKVKRAQNGWIVEAGGMTFVSENSEQILKLMANGTIPLSYDSSEDRYTEARRLWSCGNKIEAIKQVRVMDNITLKEAKDLCESWEL